MSEYNCPLCGRDDQTQIGGFCLRCEYGLTSPVNQALEETDLINPEVVDVYRHEDGYTHIRIDHDERGETDE